MNASANPTKLHQITCGLVYPAMLGALLYELAVSFLVQPKPPTPPIEAYQQLLATAVLILYTFDYAYTLDPKLAATYELPEFLLDFLLVATLLVAGLIALKKGGEAWFPIWFWLAASKGIGIVFETFRHQGTIAHLGDLNGVQSAQKSDAVAFSGYILVGVISLTLDSGAAVALFVAIALDIALYQFRRA
jgi:hypothetical protein